MDKKDYRWATTLLNDVCRKLQEKKGTVIFRGIGGEGSLIFSPHPILHPFTLHKNNAKKDHNPHSHYVTDNEVGYAVSQLDPQLGYIFHEYPHVEFYPRYPPLKGIDLYVNY